jgi:hypothetical protein
MARNKIRNLINQANARKSTGPRTPEGKNRSSLNAFKHGLTGQNMVLAEHEHEAYHLLCDRMHRDLKPKTEPEMQLAHKIIDIHFRLDRLSALESNMFNIDTQWNTNPAQPDGRYAAMIGQTVAWKKEAHAFEILGRYEARLSRQLLQYQRELERLQAIRKSAEAEEAVKAASVEVSQPTEIKPIGPDLASFRNPVPYFVMEEDSELQNVIEIAPTVPQPQPHEAAAA